MTEQQYQYIPSIIDCPGFYWNISGGNESLEVICSPSQGWIDQGKINKSGANLQICGSEWYIYICTYELSLLGVFSYTDFIIAFTYVYIM